MTDPEGVRLQRAPDTDNARGAEKLSVDPEGLPSGALEINVEGRDVTPPDEGFGQLWHKRYRVALTGVAISPTDLISAWRERFGEFWPESSRFYRPEGGLEPGNAAILDLEMLPGTRLSTGVVVNDVQPDSFTFVTTRGHSFAGFITFSAHDTDGTTVAQVDTLMRASDPLFELGMPIGGHAREDGFWQTTLTKLADHFGVEDATPELHQACLDEDRRWRKAANVRYNSYLHTGFYMLTLPFRKLVGRFRQGKGS